MSCTSPKKGFLIGKTKNNKDKYFITDYDVHHIEIDNQEKIFTKFSDIISPQVRKGYKVIVDHIDIPCGKCLSCRLQKANEWSQRILMELQQYEDNCFVTLTYDDEHIHKTKIIKKYDDGSSEEVESELSSLDKKDLQNFLKRLRKNTGKKIRYFACGEYGTSDEGTHRSHFHLILFGYKPNDLVYLKTNANGDYIYTSNEIEKAWQNRGFCTVGEATQQSAAYVARYTTKKLAEDNKKYYFENNVAEEFATMSLKPGIGYEYFISHFDELYENEYLYLSSSKGAVKAKNPRYFKKLTNLIMPEVVTLQNEKVMKLQKENKKAMLINTDEEYLERLKDKDKVLKSKVQFMKERNKGL